MSEYMTRPYIHIDRADISDEIDEVLANGLMSKGQLLDELLAAMETHEIRENWEYIKRCHELDEALYGNPEDDGKYDSECFK
jgi:hypothetical protein